jgi:hypothetical protein
MPAQEIQRLRSAPKATLDAWARSEIARYLTKRLAHDLAAWEQTAARRTNKRRGRLQKLETAIGAFTTDLLLAQNNPAAGGWVWRSLNKESFTGQTVSFRDFKALVEGWLLAPSLSELQVSKKRFNSIQGIKFASEVEPPGFMPRRNSWLSAPSTVSLLITPLSTSSMIRQSIHCSLEHTQDA